MTLELEQKVTTGHDPFDQQEEQEQRLSSEDLKTDSDDLPVGLGYEDDEYREIPSGTDY